MVGEALLAHKFRVMRLYRHHLKNMMSWEIHREAKIFEQFEAIRAEFEKNRNVPTIAEAEQLVKAGQEYLDKVKHPDPYIVPYYIGGSMYARNPPYPKEIQFHHNFGREGYDGVPGG